jgi:hypothetical protein
LAAQVVTIADSLAGTVSSAAELDLVVPPPVSNAVHDLRGWAVRVENGGGPRSATVDAARVLAYLRGLSDQQLLALLADPAVVAAGCPAGRRRGHAAELADGRRGRLTAPGKPGAAPPAAKDDDQGLAAPT